VNIGVVGAGGIGSYYTGLLTRAGHAVRLVARGDHLAAIQSRGLEVREPGETFTVRPEVTSDIALVAECEFVIVAVKGYSLASVAQPLAAAAKRGATIVPLLNGVDVAERLVALGVPKNCIVGGLAAASLVRSAPGIVERRSPFDRIVLGELDRVSRERTPRLVEAFAGAGVAARVSDDIRLDLWRKFAFIVPISVACGLSRGPAGRVLARENGRALFVGALREIVAVSQATSSALSADDETRIRDDLFALPATMRPSFLLDLEQGGPTEVDLLAGTVSRMGKEHGIATPIHDVATAAFEAATTQVG
jgi:2-dehydropantoate 2-reductase